MKNNFVILQLESMKTALIYQINDEEIIIALDKLLFNMNHASYESIEKIDRVKLIKLKGEENDN